MNKAFSLIVLLSLSGTNAFSNESAQDRHEASCVACHIIEHDDDFYTRENTRMKTHLDLRRQVSTCMVAFGVDWFPEEEAGEVKFLNDKYYKLKQ